MERGNYNLVAVFLLIISCFCGVILVASSVLADNDTVIDQVNVTVEESCTLAGVGMDSHVATLHNAEYSGQSGSDYVNGIGKTTLTAFCNDYNGFSIYAIGFTGDSYTDTNHTKLVGATDNNNTISTGVYTSGDTTSSWAMKVDKITDGTISYIPANMSIQNSFDDWHVVPDTYTKVAQYHANSGSSSTDTVLGGKLETTYQAYVSATQTADTYQGKVKYIIVHPYTEQPLQPYSSASGKICYYANASTYDGTMGCQTVSTSATTAKLFASNFSRTGYGFAGWSDAFDYATNANAHFYGPNEDITFTAGQYTGSNLGLSLYAVWVPSAGSFQSSSDTATACNGLTAASASGTRTLASVSALTDERDNQTYAIAKLADNKCWMIENLRLDNTAQLTTLNTNNPLNDNDPANPTVTIKHNYTDSQTYNTLSATSNVVYDADTAPNGWCSSITPACNNQSRLRTDNTSNRVTYSFDQVMSVNANLYLYGNYYNWYSATAGWGVSEFSVDNNSTSGDLCPSGWRLPKGGNKGRIESNNNDFWSLAVDALYFGTKPSGYDNNGYPVYSGSEEAAPLDTLIRTYPNNFVHSGNLDGSSLATRGSSGYYWSSTARSGNCAYSLRFDGSTVIPGSQSNYYTVYGRAVRCIAKAGV